MVRRYLGCFEAGVTVRHRATEKFIARPAAMFGCSLIDVDVVPISIDDLKTFSHLIENRRQVVLAKWLWGRPHGSSCLLNGLWSLA